MPKIKKYFKRVIGYIKINYCILSFPKSGRTWLRNILAHIHSGQTGKNFDLGSPEFLPFLDSSVIMNHGGVAGKGNYYHFNRHFWWKKLKFKNKKIVFLIRDPRDTIVSYYYQRTHRRKDGTQKTISEFIRDDEFGIDHMINFLNKWSDELQKMDEKNWITVKYEDMRQDTETEIKRILNLWQIKIEEDTIKKAINESRFDKMKAKEGGTDEKTHKARKGRVGGYLEELSNNDIKFIEERINQNLNEFFEFYKK